MHVLKMQCCSASSSATIDAIAAAHSRVDHPQSSQQHLAGATVLHGAWASGIRGGSTPRRFYASWRTFLLSSKSSTAKQDP